MSATTGRLHQIHPQPTSDLIFHRTHILSHSIFLLLLFHYRLSDLLRHSGDHDFPTISWCSIFAAELTLTFLWALNQPFRWRRFTRSVSIDNLPTDEKTLFPAIDVFICTADSEKEPPIEVMNTVISAMALDYPPEKLAVYLSDDGGSAATLHAVREAGGFAGRWWVPFCRKYGIEIVCPEAYFSDFDDDDDGVSGGDEFKLDRHNVKLKYEQFKQRVLSVVDVPKCEDTDNLSTCGRSSRIEVIDSEGDYDTNEKMPLLVYVSREKIPLYPQCGKAGALNALLRVSGIITNSPYILVLDCDMNCIEPTSARQAMCFHLDSHISSSLAFVQYPQLFYSGSRNDNDIYGSQAKYAFQTLWRGMDGLRGPGLSGTGFYMKRAALFGSPNQDVGQGVSLPDPGNTTVDVHHKDSLVLQPKLNFGFSDKFIESLEHKNERQASGKRQPVEDDLLIEAQFLATCTFENGTKWGSEIGFSYANNLESTFTGYFLHCKGWTSVYYYPKRPCFMGCASVDMKGTAVQLRKWSANLFQFGLSKFSPLTYGVPRMSILQSMCYAYFNFQPLFSIAYLIHGVVPQICFYKGIPLYPKASNPWFGVFAILWASSRLQYLYEHLSCGRTIQAWLNFERMSILQSVTAGLFACLDTIMKIVGVQNTSAFGLTDKVIDEEKVKRFNKGKFDFQGAGVFMAHVVVLVILNIVCFIVGTKNMVTFGDFDEMFGQLLLLLLVMVLSFSLIVR